MSVLTLSRLTELAAELASPFRVDGRPLLMRDLIVSPRRPGWSINGNSHLVRASDGWIAVTLAREEDRNSVAAWLEENPEPDPWSLIRQVVPHRDVVTLRERAELLGLPIGIHNEARARAEPVAGLQATAAPPLTGLKVLDLSALWAGPLCAALLARQGAETVRIASQCRPDPTVNTSPSLHAWMDLGKRELTFNLTDPAQRDSLIEAIGKADVLVTSARARALRGLGLTPEVLFADNPTLIWVAVTGHGWNSDRVAFGDDAAVAGGLCAEVSKGPDFLGDAIADPFTGLLAARAVVELLAAGAGGIVDASLAASAASVVRWLA